MAVGDYSPEVMDDLIERIDAGMRKHDPEYTDSDYSGASDDDLKAMEDVFRFALPDERAHFLRRPDGLNWSPNYWFHPWVFLPPEDIVKDWRFLNSLVEKDSFKERMEPPFDNTEFWWNRNWIPFAHIILGSDMLCVDVMGCFGGRPGQVIEYVNSDFYRVIKHDSFQHFLMTEVAVIEHPDFRYYWDCEDRGQREDNYDLTVEWHNFIDTMTRKINPGYPKFFPAPEDTPEYREGKAWYPFGGS
jgi:cell wall assembly regulator SMI1